MLEIAGYQPQVNDEYEISSNGSNGANHKSETDPETKKQIRDREVNAELLKKAFHVLNHGDEIQKSALIDQIENSYHWEEEKEKLTKQYLDLCEWSKEFVENNDNNISESDLKDSTNRYLGLFLKETSGINFDYLGCLTCIRKLQMLGDDSGIGSNAFDAYIQLAKKLTGLDVIELLERLEIEQVKPEERSKSIQEMKGNWEKSIYGGNGFIAFFISAFRNTFLKENIFNPRDAGSMKLLKDISDNASNTAFTLSRGIYEIERLIEERNQINQFSDEKHDLTHLKQMVEDISMLLKELKLISDDIWGDIARNYKSRLKEIQKI